MRKDIKTKFGWAPNSVINDPLLSLKAVGLWLYINSKSDSWEFSINGVKSQKKDGRSSIRSAIRELEEAGYLYRTQINENGKFGSSEWVLTDVRKSDVGKSDDAKTDVGITDVGKSHTSKTNCSKTYKSKTELSKKEGEPPFVSSIIDFLNKKTDRSFRTAGENKKLILARKKDGATEDEMKKVISMKTEEWGNDDEMKFQLRPSTLFRKSNYERYVQDLEIWKPGMFSKKSKEDQRKNGIGDSYQLKVHGEIRDYKNAKESSGWKR